MSLAKRFVCVMMLLFVWDLAEAGSSSSSTVVKDGKKITTKVKTDNKGITTTTVIIKDKKTKEVISTTTTVTDKNGKIISTDDPEAQAKADEAAALVAKRKAEIMSGPRRKANEPIVTAVFRTVIDENLKKTTKDRLFPAFRANFKANEIVRAMDQNAVDNYHKKNDFRTGKAKGFSSFSNRGPKFLSADVYVVTHARMKEKVGISKATKKVAKAPYLYYTAKIYSEFFDETWEVKQEGHILRNVQVTKEFSDKIKAVILKEIGPRMPTDSARFRRGGKQVTMDGKDLGKSLRNLFKKKKKK